MPKKQPRAPKLPPLRAVPPAPEELGDVGREYWERVAGQLVEHGILTALHLDSLRVLCETYEEYRTLADELRDNPSARTFTTESGYEGESPKVRMRDRALAAIQKLWSKFGLTPSALSSLTKSGGRSHKQSRLEAFAQGKYGNGEPHAASIRRRKTKPAR